MGIVMKSSHCRFGQTVFLSLLLCVGNLSAGDPPSPTHSSLVTLKIENLNAEDLVQHARGVLSQIDGKISLPGLTESVEVVRDRWGIPHITAKNTPDLFFAQGFVAAQDRLFQLDIWRRVGNGELAEILGESAIEGDRFARLIQFRGDWKQEWSSYSPDALEIVTAFTAGINAYIDSVEDRLPLEFQILGFRPEKWKPEDIVSRMSGIVMSANWQREIARSRLISSIGIEAARRLAPTDPPVDFSAPPEINLQDISPGIARGYLAATRPLQLSPSMMESNNWVVDGSLSTSGKPLLASDPHRALTIPSLRYLVHLKAPGWDVIGSGEPSLPGVALGHNQRIAWGITIIGTDQCDLFVEQTDPQNPRRYRVGDRWESMKIVEETVEVRNLPRGLSVELRFTRHGPVIFQDEQKHLAFALRWSGSEPGGAAYLGGLAVGRAQNQTQFLESLRSWKIPGLNFAYADVDGTIGWVAAALTPIRRTGHGLLPVPGWNGKYDWDGFLQVQDLPQEFQPAKHWVATANHKILPQDYGREIGYEFETPFRFRRIEQRLSQKKKFTLQDFQSIQHESTSLPALQLVSLLRSLDIPEEFMAYADLLKKWDGALTAESQSGPLYEIWMQELDTEYYSTRIPKSLRLERGDLRNVATLLRHLKTPSPEVFGIDPVGARDKLLRETFLRAIKRTTDLLGNDVQQWQWGKLHTATFRHPLAELGPQLEKLVNLGPVPRSGDGHTPNNTRFNDKLEQIHGASYRHVLDLADWDLGMATSTPGQSGQPGSPHYGDLLPLWARGEYFPLAYSPSKVNEVAAHRLILSPR